MDPTAALQLIRDAIADGDTTAALEAFQDLDEWLSKGGFLPADWDSTRDHTTDPERKHR